MIALPVDGVAAVGVVRPGRIRQIFEVWLLGPGPGLTLAGTLATVDFLQENEIRTGSRDQSAHAIEHETAVAAAVALVDVVGEYAQWGAHGMPGAPGNGRAMLRDLAKTLPRTKWQKNFATTCCVLRLCDYTAS